ncbi:hypothetical protein BJ170DRAFT_594242 [Xylariales sp. AK1849]|nr:hypothetical protein BJ170DRAFT_594242 [Xylariales sp. AK1849]
MASSVRRSACSCKYEVSSTLVIMRQLEVIQQQEKVQEEVAATKHPELLAKVRLVGNYVHDSVSVSDTKDDNLTARTWEPEGFDRARKPSSRQRILWKLGRLIVTEAKKYDLEAYLAFQSEHKELLSCSSSTDYQTRELEVRYGTSRNKDMVGGGEKEYVYGLNDTLFATERTLCCILEDLQTDLGLLVPEVQRKYIRSQPDFIQFVKESLAQPDLVKLSVAWKTA